MSPASALSVGRLRMAAPAAGVVPARLAAEALLAEVAAVRTGLPPQSILLTPKLELPVPTRALSRFPDLALRQRVKALATQALEQAAQSAAWPAHGDVPKGEVSVVFADEAELLACLARDAVRGELGRWWWRLVLGAQHPDWTRAFSRYPHAVPAALRLLERLQLDPSECAAVRRALGVDALRGARSASPAPRPFSGETQSNSAHPQRHDSLSAADDAHSPMLVARAFDSSDVDALSRSPEAHRVGEGQGSLASDAGPLGAPIEAVLVHGPSVVAHGLVASEALRSESAATHERVIAKRAVEPTSPSAANTGVQTLNAQPVPVEPLAAMRAREPLGVSIAGERDPTHGERLPSLEQPEAKSVTPWLEQIRRALGSLAPARDSGEPPASSAEREPALEPWAESSPAATSAQVEACTLPVSPTPLFTQYGGLFFLVNVLLGQELYPDFTRPRDRGFPVPLWLLVALLGRRLIGRRICSDPIWALLLDLDPQPIPDPDEDLSSWWTTSGARTRQAPSAEGLANPVATPLGLWLADFTAWLRVELAAALGWPVFQVGRRIASLEAKVWVSECQIVVQMPLDALPVEIRLAGLDRDPGFLPSVGRTLRFVFE